jgi:hypothetical protein
VVCFVRPLYGFKRWELPVQRVNYPQNKNSEKEERLRWFARLLLEGKVCIVVFAECSCSPITTVFVHQVVPELAACVPWLCAPPAAITMGAAESTIASLSSAKRVQRMLRKLGLGRQVVVDTRAALLERWRADPAYLKDAYSEWVRPEHRNPESFAKVWSKLVKTALDTAAAAAKKKSSKK